MPILFKPLPSAEYLRERFIYDPISGELIWKPKPANNRENRRWNKRHAYKVVGSIIESGYRAVGLDYDLYLAHRIIYKMTFNKEPPEMLDHINGDRDDSRLCNLREATHAENRQNARMPKNNTSGCPGVIKVKNRYRVTMMFNKRRIYLGTFLDFDEACDAYRQASDTYRGKFSPYA